MLPTHPSPPHSLSLPFAASSHIFFNQKHKIGLTLWMFIDCMHRVSSRCYNRLLHTNIVPNVIQYHWMSGCGMLQAQGKMQCNSNASKCRYRRFSDCATNSRAMTSHTRTVERECFKGDEASQWKRPKFDPSPHQNPLTDLHQNWQAWLRPGRHPACKIL